MLSSTAGHADLLPLLPESILGVVENIEPINIGLSGAGVYAVATSRGSFVLRVQPNAPEPQFVQQLRVLRRASAAFVAPAVVHVVETARAVVSVRIAGMPLAAVLAQPAQRDVVLASVVDALQAVHALDTSGVEARDPLGYARAAWDACRDRPGFPSWAASLEPAFTEFSGVLERDGRRVVSHNDVNPANFLWDGARVWLIDWEIAGLGHPYYDLAALALFLRLDDDAALALVARHDGAPPDERARHTFRALRRLAGLITGLTFLGLVDDLRVRSAAMLADAPSLADCYAGLRTGQLDMQSAHGRASMGLALLALGCAP